VSPEPGSRRSLDGLPDLPAIQQFEEEAVTTKYEKAVAEARRLVSRSEEDQWRLAELTWQQVEDGKTRQQWARDVGVHPSTTGRWYKMWVRWGGLADQQLRPPFAEAWEVITGAAVATEQHGSDYAAKARTAIRNMAPERKAEIARDLLADEEVAQAVVEHPETMRAVNRAASRTDTGKQVARAVKAHEARAEESGPAPVTPLQVLPMFLEHASALREFIGRATVDGVTPDALPMIEGLGKHLAATAEQALAITAGTPVKVTDADLDAWLSGETR
jgi:hypothetical protein